MVASLTHSPPRKDKMLELQPITYKEACLFIEKYHRHHLPPQGWKFGIGLNDGVNVIGVVTIGRPVARNLDDGYTAEITRCCTDGTKNACSKLYSAAWRAARAMGYKRIITYILESENGASLRASNFREVYSVKGRSWTCKSRPRVDKHPIENKKLFEIK